MIRKILNFALLLTFVMILACGRSQNSDADRFILEFKFKNPDVTGTIEEVARPKKELIPSVNNPIIISVIVPKGINLTNLEPVIVHTGESISPASGIAQDFTKAVTYVVKGFDGSEEFYEIIVKESPLNIYTIEDLIEIGIDADTKKGTNYNLMNDLDFKNDNSYENPNSTEYGDINGDGVVEGLKTELTTSRGWMPLSDNFTGSIFGNSYSISNLYINRDMDKQGLFAKLNQGSLIKDLILRNADLKTASKSGILAGEIEGSSIINTKVEDSKMNIYVGEVFDSLMYFGQECIGAFGGYAENTEFQNCKVEDVSFFNDNSFIISYGMGIASRRVGGLLGMMNGGSILNTSVIDSTLEGLDEATTIGKRHILAYAGGLVGEVVNEGKDTLVINNCSAENIKMCVGDAYAYTSDGRENYESSRSGGLIGAIGHVESNFNSSVEISNSFATGDISAVGLIFQTVGGIGGFAGYISGENAPSNIKIDRCYADVEIGTLMRNPSYLDVFLDHMIKSKGGVGGFVGTLKNVDIMNSYALGSLKNENSAMGWSGCAFGGGFSGWIENSSISQCYAKGNIDGCDVGGFVGIIENSSFKKSYASGNLTGNSIDFAGRGGFFGGVISGLVSINNCYSTGDIESGFLPAGSFGGGIKTLGITVVDKVEINNCYATGNVKSYQNVGGFIGHSQKKLILKDSLTFATEVVGITSSDTVGRGIGFVGTDTEIKNFYANSAMSVKYNTSTIKTGTSDKNTEWGGDITASQLIDKNFYTDSSNWESLWNFDDIWEIKAGALRPTLIDSPKGRGNDDGSL